jgi:hypothetical protein
LREALPASSDSIGARSLCSNLTRRGGGVSSLDIHGNSGDTGRRMRVGGVSHSWEATHGGGVAGSGSISGTNDVSSLKPSMSGRDGMTLEKAFCPMSELN